MKIQVDFLSGDASVIIFNKNEELIHTEHFTGFISGVAGWYTRSIPVSEAEYGFSKSVYTGTFEYKVIS